MKPALRNALTGLSLLSVTLPLGANDSAASVAMGGVILTREPRISMESERLTISLSKITVEYEFLNESDTDITTEVAFPIPPYANTEEAGGIRDFDDFKLWVDGKELNYDVESKAFLGHYDQKRGEVVDKTDVTSILRKYNIDIPSLGRYTESKAEQTPDFDRLPLDARRKLAKQGLVDTAASGDLIGFSRPNWEVRKTYHWKQTFPAHRVLPIRHEYSPAVGFYGIQAEDFGTSSDDKPAGNIGGANYLPSVAELLNDTCVGSAIRKVMHSTAVTAQDNKDPSNGYTEAMWVNYILTTANSWKTPIKRFDLVIERGPEREGYMTDWDYASLCWDGSVKKIGEHGFEASATNFVPKKDLMVLFLFGQAAQAGAKAAEVTASSGLLSHRLSSRLAWILAAFALAILAAVWTWWQRRWDRS